MKYIDEFRDKALVQILVNKIHSVSKKHITIMEVCGGHTMSIHKYGIHSLLPQTINLVSGPGCPVCVTDRRFIDHAIALSKRKDIIIATYGDLIRVPGSTSSLELQKAKGADIRVVYSTLDATKIAKDNPDKELVFLGIGFETTTPSSALAIIEAKTSNLNNFSILCAHKVMPPAMSALIDEGIKIDGYIGPGHVSTIAGSNIYSEIAEKYNLAIVISGFEPVDILQSVYMLVEQIENAEQKTDIQYTRAVKPEGNLKAKAIVNEIFELRDDWWRGLGVIPKSGLAIRDQYKGFDAEKKFKVILEKTIEPKGCICGDILKGIRKPDDCKLFRKICTPLNPVGACMVSGEGACNAFYKYK
ncbi:MAG: hydrogenase formation protein HypD [Prolixibacteraceae bacterium]|nr:hydrogenase formation protein HypD [Prolixibacteraceae bacterium]